MPKGFWNREVTEQDRKKWIENFKGGMKGKTRSEESKRKTSNSLMGHEGHGKGIPRPQMSGKNNVRWKGGYENDLMLHRQRRIRKMKAEGSHTLGEWELLKKQYGYICPACGKKEPEIKLTEDHIIPLSKGGSDYIENIQPLCGSCNSSKRSKVG